MTVHKFLIRSKLIHTSCISLREYFDNFDKKKSVFRSLQIVPVYCLTGYSYHPCLGGYHLPSSITFSFIRAMSIFLFIFFFPVCRNLTVMNYYGTVCCPRCVIQNLVARGDGWLWCWKDGSFYFLDSLLIWS